MTSKISNAALVGLSMNSANNTRLRTIITEAIARFRTEGQTIFADYLEQQLQSAGEGER